MKKNKDFDDKLPTIPNDKYVKYFNRFKEIETLDISNWKTVHLLSYFCKKYKEMLGEDYSWKFNNENPTKCFEVWQMNTLSSKLSSNPKILKDYIDWAFDTLVKDKKYRPRSISFLTKEEAVVPYKMNVLFAGQNNTTVSRSTLLPPNYKDTLEKMANISINTYGELAFIVQINPMPIELSAALNVLAETGLDKEAIKRIV